MELDFDEWMDLHLPVNWLFHSGKHDGSREEKVSTELSFSFASAYWGCKLQLLWRVGLTLWLEGRWDTLKRLRTEHWRVLKPFCLWLLRSSSWPLGFAAHRRIWSSKLGARWTGRAREILDLNAPFAHSFMPWTGRARSGMRRLKLVSAVGFKTVCISLSETVGIGRSWFSEMGHEQ